MGVHGCEEDKVYVEPMPDCVFNIEKEKMMSRELLPIGSVVLLEGGEKRVMICGRIQTKTGDNQIYDYSACYYPEGIVDPKQMFFFNNDAISRIFFIGFQDPEEIALREMIDSLGELTIRDGQIVPVNPPQDEV